MTRLTLALLLAWCGSVCFGSRALLFLRVPKDRQSIATACVFTFGGITGGRILKWTDGPRRETQPGLLEPPGRVEVFRMYGASGLI